MQEQTWDDQLENIVIHMQTRQAQVKSIIQKYVSRYASMNMPLGTLGTFIPLPGANVIALAATIMAQGAEMFQPLEREIAQVYQISPDDTRSTHTPENGQARAASSPTSALLSEFMREFSHPFITEAVIKQATKELLLHYLPALAIETIIDWLPIPGGVVSASINTVTEVLLTRRIGVMLASYFENGQQWIGNSPAKTDDILRNYGDGYASVDDIPSIPEVSAGIITRLLAQNHTIYEEAGVDIYKEVHQLLANILRLKFLRANASVPDCP